jgi:ankyrin repeat protein
MEAIDLNAYIYEDEWNRVEDYIRTGGDVNIVTAEGKALLHFAAERDRLDILRLLLRKGANPNLQDEDGKTPLHYAFDVY